MTTETPPRRRRIGCLGQLILLALLAGGGFLAVMAITNPWIYTVGGRFRILPFWAGVGDLQGPGGTYRIYVWFQPSNASSHVLPSTSVDGSGWICPPSGAGYQMRLGGGAHEVVWRDMDNKPFSLYMYQRGVWSSQHLPPRVEFTGRWMGPNLVMNDKGTMDSAFSPDGSVKSRPGARGTAQAITFTETQWWVGRPCR